MRCQTCGNELPPNAQACSHCHTPVAAPIQSGPQPFGVPADFQWDQSSGMYYKSELGADPATGAPVQIVTWYDINTGQFTPMTYPAEQVQAEPPQPVIPEGYEFDASSGWYFKNEIGVDPGNGMQAQVVTWFDPAQGTYTPAYYPIEQAAEPEPIPEPVPEPVPEFIPEPVPEPVPEPIPVSQPSIPEGYEFDASSGWYFKNGIGVDPGNGMQAQVVTWFDPAQGTYTPAYYPIEQAAEPEPVPEPAPEPIPESVPEPVPAMAAQQQTSIPGGYEYDPSSGLYYKSETGYDPNTGVPSQIVTWYDPIQDTYTPSFYPLEISAPQPSQLVIPEGYEFDPDSGLYFRSDFGTNPETGQYSQIVTWYDAQQDTYTPAYYPAAEPAPAVSVPTPADTASNQNSKKADKPQKDKNRSSGKGKGIAGIVITVVILVALLGGGAAVYFTGLYQSVPFLAELIDGGGSETDGDDGSEAASSGVASSSAESSGAVASPAPGNAASSTADQSSPESTAPAASSAQPASEAAAEESEAEPEPEPAGPEINEAVLEPEDDPPLPDGIWPAFAHTSAFYLEAAEDDQHYYMMHPLDEEYSDVELLRMDKETQAFECVIQDGGFGTLMSFALLGDYVYFATYVDSGTCAYHRVLKSGSTVEFLFLEEFSYITPYDGKLFFMFSQSGNVGVYAPGGGEPDRYDLLSEEQRANEDIPFIFPGFSVFDDMLYYSSANEDETMTTLHQVELGSYIPSPITDIPGMVNDIMVQGDKLYYSTYNGDIIEYNKLDVTRDMRAPFASAEDLYSRPALFSRVGNLLYYQNGRDFYSAPIGNPLEAELFYTSNDDPEQTYLAYPVALNAEWIMFPHQMVSIDGSVKLDYNVTSNLSINIGPALSAISEAMSERD